MGADLARFFLELLNTVEDIPDGGGQPPLLLHRQEIEGDSLCCAWLSRPVIMYSD
jgi:hypothetical protein